MDPDLNGLVCVLALALPMLVHAIVGNIIEPKVFGDSLELHPIVVLLALAFWYALWGAPGAILSVPITAVTRIILGHVKHRYAIVLLFLLEGKVEEAFSEKHYRHKRSKCISMNSTNV